MPMPSYAPIQSITLTADTNTVSFIGIDQNYTDLEIIVNARGSHTDNANFYYRINGDTGANYSVTRVQGNGSSAASNRGNSQSVGYIGYVDGSNSTAGIFGNTKIIVNNYTAASPKNLISKGATPGTNGYAAFFVNCYRGSTLPVTSISFTPDAGNWVAGSTFSLYGISPVNAKVAAAFGGTDITYDSTYVYHVFKSSGVFTPTRSLSCDYLVVAGGGSGGNNIGGGGGAGGFRIATSQSLTATSYTVTVGAGGGDSSSGNTSTFNGLATTGGGAGGGANVNGSSGGSGGGGGGATTGTGGVGNAGAYTPVEGFTGGNGNRGSGANRSGGGGGAGAVGENFQTGRSGNGGIGSGGVGYTNYTLINAMALATNTGVLSSGNYYYAGGGGGGNQGVNVNGVGGIGGGGAGGNNTNGIPGTTNTGSGGGGGGNDLTNGFSGGAGGSGIVIVRYAR